jgi:hypothetical protein
VLESVVHAPFSSVTLTVPLSSSLKVAFFNSSIVGGGTCLPHAERSERRETERKTEADFMESPWFSLENVI